MRCINACGLFTSLKTGERDGPWHVWMQEGIAEEFHRYPWVMINGNKEKWNAQMSKSKSIHMCITSCRKWALMLAEAVFFLPDLADQIVERLGDAVGGLSLWPGGRNSQMESVSKCHEQLQERRLWMLRMYGHTCLYWGAHGKPKLIKRLFHIPICQLWKTHQATQTWRLAQPLYWHKVPNKPLVQGSRLGHESPFWCCIHST